MTDACDDCGRIFYAYGDRVRLVQNHLLTGQVIGEMDWHGKYNVRLGGTVTAAWFEECELEPDPEFYEPGGAARPPVPEEDSAKDNNVISLAERRAVGGIH